MKNLSKFEVTPLNNTELKETEGGILGLILAAVAVTVATANAGYTLGKDLYHVLND